MYLDFKANKQYLVGALREALDAAEIDIRGVTEKFRDARDIYVLGRSIHYPIAHEGALKIKELFYIHAEGIAVGELKHGSLALIDRNSYVIIINP